MSLQFDASTHTYTAGGRRVPSVTEILADVGLIDSRWFTDGACLRGQFVAQAVAYDQRGELDDSTLDPALLPYVAAARAFREALKFEPTCIEHCVWSETWNYAGTLDLLGTSALIGRGEILIDYKAGASAAWHPLQTKAYALALDRVVIRGTVLLRPNGSYRFCEHFNERQDETLWLAAVQVYHAKQRMAA